MSLYADYIEELTHGHCYENEKGFATYIFSDEKTCYIKDIYIVPKFRKRGAASDIAAHIEGLAKKRGCTILLGSVVPSAKGSTESLKVLCSYGFRLDSSAVDYILFKKDIS